MDSGTFVNTSLASDRVQLMDWIKKLSYREGDFTLSSGKKSSFYIDLKATTLHPAGAHLIGKLGVEVLLQAHLPVDAVGGLTLGADPVATAISLAAHARGKLWPAYIVRKEPKKHGTEKYIEGAENLRPGAACVVLEDVVTTGASSLKAIERLKAEGFRPVAVLTVVDREDSERAGVFERAGVPLLSLVKLSDLRSNTRGESP